MSSTIATLTGTGLIPGVSANKRVYTADHITRAVARAQQRLESGGRPLTMRTHHPKPGESAHVPVTETVGRLTSIWQDPDGRLRFRGALAGTEEGSNVLTLVDNRRGQQPFIKNVSIRGAWLGKVRKVPLSDGSWGETADDLEIDGIDFTHRPGVEGAEIEHVSGPGDGADEAGPDGRTVIYESAPEVLVTEISEAGGGTPGDNKTGGPAGGAVMYADPGYLRDGQKRYPLDTKAGAKTAWHAINESDTARRYTGAQLKRIRGKIVKGLGRHGVTVIRQGVGEAAWLMEVTPVTEAMATALDLSEAYGYGERSGSFSVCLDNGMVCVSVSSYCVDPHDLDALGRAAMTGACQALAAMDPDMDGDIDVAGAPAEDLDRSMAGEAGTAVPAAADETSTGPAENTPATETAPPGVDVPVTESPAPTADAAPTTESEGSAMAETTPAAPVTEAAPTTTAAAPAAVDPALIAQITTSVIESMETARMRRKAAKRAALAEAATAAAAGQTPVAETAPATTPAAPAAQVATPATDAAPAAGTEVTESDIQRRIDEAVKAKFTALVQEGVRNGEISVSRKGHVARVTESGEVTPVGSTTADVELNAHGLPRSWAGEQAAHELKGAARSHLSAVLSQHVIGHRI
jgi:hypothetical protein